MNKLVSEGLQAGMYEYTVAANGCLSDWSAEPVMVVKDETDPWAEQRLTINYSHVTETLPGTGVPLLCRNRRFVVGSQSGFLFHVRFEACLLARPRQAYDTY
jgi:hypothetical protein